MATHHQAVRFGKKSGLPVRNPARSELSREEESQRSMKDRSDLLRAEIQT